MKQAKPLRRRAGAASARAPVGSTNRPEQAAPPLGRHLLVTFTNEPFQPVRLYYSIPDSEQVIGKLRKLKCMIEVPPEGCWQWLFHAESAKVQLAGTYDDVPKEKRPIVLGRIRFPASGSMTLQTNSIQRAIAGVRFFGPRLGADVVALRCRLVNRCFAAEEGTLDELMKQLDRDVTVIDPRAAEAAMKRDAADLRRYTDPEQMASQFMARRLASKEDVPLVEDFPLAPEEETPEFTHLANMLQLRSMRAIEHWRGNTHLTLASIIMRLVEEDQRTRRGR